MIFESERLADRLWIIFIVIAVTILAIFLSFIKAHKTRREKQIMDKRTAAVQRKGNQIAIWTMIGWTFVYVVLCAIRNKPLMKDGLCLVVGLLLSGTVRSCYCILHDAWFVGERKEGSEYWYTLLIAVCWLFMGILDWDRGRLIRDEVLSYYALRLLIGLSFSAEFLAIAVKRWLKARSER